MSHLLTTVLPVHEGLIVRSRIPSLAREGQRLRTIEFVFLVSMGVCAALIVAYMKLGLKIPGHAIIRSVFPMAFGLAVAPRRMAGSVMSGSAVGFALILNATVSASIGIGAMSSLCLIGPLLDISLWNVKRGWRLYLGFALAGLGANLAALAVRGGTKWLELDHAGGRPFALWWPQAMFTYVASGVIAGLISAMVWFQLNARKTAEPERSSSRSAAGSARDDVKSDDN